MEYKAKEGDFFYILENTKPKRVLYSTWVKWMDENRENIQTVLYFVEDGITANFFFHGKGGKHSYDDDGRPLLWWITEFDMSYTEYQEIYDRGVRIEGVDLLAIIEQRKALELGEDEYEGLDSFSMFATQDDAIEALKEGYGDWRSKAIILEPNKLPPFELDT